MQKKKENIFNKIVKKDYNNELELVLEKKQYSEFVKNMLLNIIYNIEAGYKDYSKIKKDILTKDRYIKKIMNIVEKECNIIKLVKKTDEEKIPNNKTFFIDKKRKIVMCEPIERKLMYCLSKIEKQEFIVKDKYPIIDKAISELINVGYSINFTEIIRDFNGYSWTTIEREIESIHHNLIYQNFKILLNNEFFEKWINNKEFIIDYYDNMKIELEELYGKHNSEQLIYLFERIAVILMIKFDKNLEQKFKQEEIKVKKQILELEDRQQFIKKISAKKTKLSREVGKLDEIINNPILLEKEYIERNEKLELAEKIFSMKVLAKNLKNERKTKIEEIEKLNSILNPKIFLEYVKDINNKYEYLQIINIEDLELELKNKIFEFQQIFLECFKRKVAREALTKSQLEDLIYEFRYYLNISCEGQFLHQNKELEQNVKIVLKLLIEKAKELKKITEVLKTDKNSELEYMIYRTIFKTRVINLDEVEVKITHEKQQGKLQKNKNTDNIYTIKTYYEDVIELEEEIQIEDIEIKKEIRKIINKKIKLLN